MKSRATSNLSNMARKQAKKALAVEAIKNGWVSLQDIVRMTGVSYKSVQIYMAELVAEKKADLRHEKCKTGQLINYYRIVDPNANNRKIIVKHDNNPTLTTYYLSKRKDGHNKHDLRPMQYCIQSTMAAVANA